jgi:hypothetical protein
MDAIWVGTEFVYEKVSIADAKRVLDGDDAKECEQPSWDLRRLKLKQERLLPDTLKWMALLPQKLRPFTLARRYPRIANEICRQWRLPARCGRYMEELLIVDSAGRKRQGFPPQVASEIAALAGYHSEQLQDHS